MPSTTTILYFLIPDIAILIIAIKLIFKDSATFEKSLTDHFWPDEVLSKRERDWAEKNDPQHKTNIIYAIALALVGLNILIYASIF